MKRMFYIIPPAGCIPAEELQFVMNHLPGKVGDSGENIVKNIHRCMPGTQHRDRLHDQDCGQEQGWQDQLQ